MGKTIYKYPLKPMTSNSVIMPKGAEILFIGHQSGAIYIWALVDPHEKTEFRDIEIFGTGWDMHFDMGVTREFIGTVQMHDGLVWHVFENTSF